MTPERLPPDDVAGRARSDAEQLRSKREAIGLALRIVEAQLVLQHGEVPRHPGHRVRETLSRLRQAALDRADQPAPRAKHRWVLIVLILVMIATSVAGIFVAKSRRAALSAAPPPPTSTKTP